MTGHDFLPSNLPSNAVAALRHQARGRVLTPHDGGWEEAAMSWSLLPQSPLAVVQAADADDVAAIVQWAAEWGVAVAAQPSGHAATGSVDGCVLLRTGALTSAAVDVEGRVARVGAGVKWGQLLPMLDGTGLVAPAGSNPDVTVVGYLLGGGLSWFSRHVGYAAHALRAAQVVDARGAVRWVSDESDPELMWALRGGGGDLVAVVQAELDLQPAPALYAGKLIFPVDDAAPVLRAFRSVAESAPQELTLWASVTHFPDAEMVPADVRGRSLVSVDATFLGEAGTGSALLEPVRGAGSLLEDTTGVLPIGRLGEVADEPTDPTPFLDWATYLDDLSDATIDRLVAATGDRSRTAISILQLRHVGGALADPPAPRPAVADRTRAPYLAEAVGIPVSPDRLPAIRASLDDVARALEPAVSDERLPLNFLGVGDRLERALDPPTLVRLRALKRALDPAGVLRGNVPLLADVAGPWQSPA